MTENPQPTHEAAETELQPEQNLSMPVESSSSVGGREENQDRSISLKGVVEGSVSTTISLREKKIAEVLSQAGIEVALVCDGIGGHARGGEAATHAAKGFVIGLLNQINEEFFIKSGVSSLGELNPATLQKLFQDKDFSQKIRQLIEDSVANANRSISMMTDFKSVRGNAGTTLTATVVFPREMSPDHPEVKRAEQVVEYAQAGDSAAYVIDRRGKIRRVTPDHSLPEENKNIITRSLSGDNNDLSQHAEFGRVFLNEGEQLLICSDGIDQLTQEEIEETIALARRGRKDVAQALIDKINGQQLMRLAEQIIDSELLSNEEIEQMIGDGDDVYIEVTAKKLKDEATKKRNELLALAKKVRKDKVYTGLHSLKIPQWDSHIKDIDQFRDSSDITVDDFYLALFRDDGIAIDFPDNEKKLIQRVFERNPKTEIAKITAYSHDNITAMIVGEFEEKATLTERAKDKWQAFWKKVKGVFKGKPSPEDSQDGQLVQEEDSSATDLEKDKKTGLLSKAKGWLKNVRNKWRERREQRRSKKEPQESEGAGQEGSSSDEENMGFSYNASFRLGQLLKKVRERRGARKENKQARSEQADSSDSKSSEGSHKTGFRIGRFLRNIKDRWTSRRESKKAAREAGEVDEESEDSLSSSERRSQQVEKLINQLSLISLDSLKKLGIVKEGVNIEERRPGQLSQEIEMFRGKLDITRSNIKSNLDVLKSLEEKHSRLSGKSDEEGKKDNLERISDEIEKRKRLLEQLKKKRASIIGKLANRYSQLARIEKKAESDQSTPELNLSVEHLSFNPANRRQTEKILKIAGKNMDESVEDHQKIIDALQKYLHDLEQIKFGPLERIRKQPITQRFGKIMDAIRGWASEKWENRPRSVAEWNDRRRQKSRERWSRTKDLYESKQQRWANELEIESVSSDELNGWELALRQGKTLEAKQVVALVLNQRIGWMPELKKHRAVLKEAGIDLQHDLMDWLRFQWEKKLTDEKNERDEEVVSLKVAIEAEDNEGARESLQESLGEARNKRLGALLKLVNLKVYDQLRHWAVAEAGVDRMGRPNLSGVAKEDLEGEGLRKFIDEIKSYVDIRNLSNISTADRNVAYYLTYFPALTTLLINPGLAASTKHIITSVLTTANVAGESVRRTIELKYGGNAEAFWQGMQEKKGLSNRALSVLMRVASSRAVEGMQRGAAGAAGAASVAEILNLRGLTQKINDSLSRGTQTQSELPEEVQQIMSEHPELQEEVGRLEEEFQAVQQELEEAQKMIDEGITTPESVVEAAIEGLSGLPEALSDYSDYFTVVKGADVGGPFWAQHHDLAEQIGGNANSLANFITRFTRVANPTQNIANIDRAAEYVVLKPETVEALAPLVKVAEWEYATAVANETVNQLDPVVKLLAAGYEGTLKPTINPEEAAMVLDLLRTQ